MKNLKEVTANDKDGFCGGFVEVHHKPVVLQMPAGEARRSRLC